MKQIKSYRDLEIWQKAMSLTTEVYRMSNRLPRAEQWGLASQMQRAAVSIPANIAEGWGRSSRREFLQFLRISRGSLCELETHLILAEQLGYLTQAQTAPLLEQCDRLSRMLLSLMRSLEHKT